MFNFQNIFFAVAIGSLFINGSSAHAQNNSYSGSSVGKLCEAKLNGFLLTISGSEECMVPMSYFSKALDL